MPEDVSTPAQNTRMESFKRCPSCMSLKSIDEFNWRDKAHTKLQSYCRDCSNRAWRRWYREETNRRRHLDTLYLRRRRRIDRHQQLITELKSQPCADCGQVFPPYAMDFDHLGDKAELVSTLVYSSGTERLLAEVGKCEVVCANCHRMRTYRRLNGEPGNPF